MSIKYLLVKTKRIHDQLEASKPVDPLASLTREQRTFYAAWWAKFYRLNTGNVYEAQINFEGWTPSLWLERSTIKSGTSIEQAADAYKKFKVGK